MNGKTATDGGTQRGAEWAIGSVVMPVIATVALLFIAGMGWLHLSMLDLSNRVSSLSERVSDLSNKVSTQTGIIQTTIPFLKEEHDNIRAELGKDLTGHYSTGHDESGGG